MLPRGPDPDKESKKSKKTVGDNGDYQKLKSPYKNVDFAGNQIPPDTENPYNRLNRAGRGGAVLLQESDTDSPYEYANRRESPPLPKSETYKENGVLRRRLSSAQQHPATKESQVFSAESAYAGILASASMAANDAEAAFNELNNELSGVTIDLQASDKINGSDNSRKMGLIPETTEEEENQTYIDTLTALEEDPYYLPPDARAENPSASNAMYGRQSGKGNYAAVNPRQGGNPYNLVGYNNNNTYRVLTHPDENPYELPNDPDSSASSASNAMYMDAENVGNPYAAVVPVKKPPENPYDDAAPSLGYQNLGSGPGGFGSFNNRKAPALSFSNEHTEDDDPPYMSIPETAADAKKIAERYRGQLQNNPPPPPKKDKKSGLLTRFFTSPRKVKHAPASPATAQRSSSVPADPSQSSNASNNKKPKHTG